MAPNARLHLGNSVSLEVAAVRQFDDLVIPLRLKGQELLVVASDRPKAAVLAGEEQRATHLDLKEVLPAILDHVVDTAGEVARLSGGDGAIHTYLHAFGDRRSFDLALAVEQVRVADQRELRSCGKRRQVGILNHLIRARTLLLLPRLRKIPQRLQIIHGRFVSPRQSHKYQET